MYSGNYDFYVREREVREANQEAAYARQQAKLAKEQRFIERFSRTRRRRAGAESREGAGEDREDRAAEKAQVVKFDFRNPPRSGDDVAMLEHVDKKVRIESHLRRFRFQGPPKRALVRDGKEWRRQSTLLKMVVGALTPDAGTVRLGAALKLGYFSQQSLDLLDRDLTVWEQMQKDFPLESIGTLRNLLGAFQFSGDDPTREFDRCPAARNRA